MDGSSNKSQVGFSCEDAGEAADTSQLADNSDEELLMLVIDEFQFIAVSKIHLIVYYDL